MQAKLNSMHYGSPLKAIIVVCFVLFGSWLALMPDAQMVSRVVAANTTQPVIHQMSLVLKLTDGTEFAKLNSSSAAISVELITKGDGTAPNGSQSIRAQKSLDLKIDPTGVVLFDLNSNDLGPAGQTLKIQVKPGKTFRYAGDLVLKTDDESIFKNPISVPINPVQTVNLTVKVVFAGTTRPSAGQPVTIIPHGSNSDEGFGRTPGGIFITDSKGEIQTQIPDNLTYTVLSRRDVHFEGGFESVELDRQKLLDLKAEITIEVPVPVAEGRILIQRGDGSLSPLDTGVADHELRIKNSDTGTINLGIISNGHFQMYQPQKPGRYQFDLPYGDIPFGDYTILSGDAILPTQFAGGTIEQDLILKPRTTGMISFVIVDSKSRKGVPDAHLKLTTPFDAPLDLQTDNAGNASRENQPRGEYSVYVTSKNYNIASTRADLEDSRPLEIQVDPYRSLNVEVSDDKGNPLQATVLAKSLLRPGTGISEAKTDANGSANISKLCDGKWDLSVVIDGAVCYANRVTIDGDGGKLVAVASPVFPVTFTFSGQNNVPREGLEIVRSKKRILCGHPILDLDGQAKTQLMQGDYDVYIDMPGPARQFVQVGKITVNSDPTAARHFSLKMPPDQRPLLEYDLYDEPQP